jgi:hypothetical protein
MARRSTVSPFTTNAYEAPPSVRTAPFGTSATGRASGAAASAASRRKVTFTPMSGRMRGSSSLKPMRTSTVAFCRSAVGTVVMTRAGIWKSGYASSTAVTGCPSETRPM